MTKMLTQTISNHCIKVRWLTNKPISDKKYSLLIPQYNESKHKNFIQRLEYFNELSIKVRDFMNIILIDDGSTDGSVELMKSFIITTGSDLYLACTSPNSNKVGALYLVSLEVESPYIILSDFDTDIKGLEKLEHYVSKCDDDPSLLGGYFRMLPFEGKGWIFRFQQLEYALARALYIFFEKERSVPVMPGAGSLYKRDVLIEIFKMHSGLRNGEDRESCVIGRRLGYGTIYMKEIFALTRPPLNFIALIKQRRRWNLGYWETIQKEKKFYYSQLTIFTRIGLSTFLDTLTMPIYILAPLFVCLFLFLNIKIAITVLLAQYLFAVLKNFLLVTNSANEYSWENERYLSTFLCYPAIKGTLEFCAWGKVILYLIKNKSKDRAKL